MIWGGLHYKIYDAEGAMEGRMPFKFSLNDVAVVPKTPAARFEMMRDVLIAREELRAEAENRFGGVLASHALGSTSEKCVALERSLSGRSALRPVLKNMVKFEVLYNILRNPEPYMQ